MWLRFCSKGDVCFGQSRDISKAARNVIGQPDSPHGSPQSERCPKSKKMQISAQCKGGQVLNSHQAGDENYPIANYSLKGQARQEFFF
jgi:hypothetical protein